MASKVTTPYFGSKLERDLRGKLPPPIGGEGRFFPPGSRSGGGGGGSSSQGFSQDKQKAEEASRRIAEQQAQQAAAQQAQQQAAQQQAAQQQAATQRQAELTKAQQQKTIISASGGVRRGDRGYYGETVVPDTGGLTANQLRRQVQQQAVQSKQIKQQDVGRTRFEISPAKKEEVVEKEKKQPTQQNILEVQPLKQDKSFSNLFGLPSFIETKKESLITKQSRGRGGMGTQAGLTGLGFASAFTSFGVAVVNPIETTKALYGVVKHPVASSKELSKMTTQSFQVNPSGSIGRLFGEVAILKSPKIITKVSDVIRTKGLTKIPTESVVAPEFFKGQTYPAISKGQTAGQLLQEFKQPSQYGVTKLSGFTASPKPFKSTTTALKGTSELPGVYQAPKISPKFLRVGGETKPSFSLNPLGTLRPSVMQITPEEFRLLGGVKETTKTTSGRIGLKIIKQQTIPTTLEEIKNFFKKAPLERFGKDIPGAKKLKTFVTAEKGKSYIPFIKTEKEAVIPFGTTLQKFDKRFYFEFEGRNVPITEFKVVQSVTGKAIKHSGVISSESASSIYSRGVSQRGVVTPLEVTSISKVKTSKPIQEVKSYSIVSKPTSSYTAPSYSKSIVSYTSPYSKASSSSSVSKAYSSVVSSPKSSTSYKPSSSKPSKSYSPSSLYSGSSSYRRTPPYSPPKIPKTVYPPYLKGTSKPKTPKQRTGKFPVYARRFGKWKSIGFGRTRGQALKIGKQYSTKTLGRSFYVPGVKPQKILPGFRTKKEKGKGLIYIQKTGKGAISTLGSKGEKQEIKYYQTLKGGKK